MIESTPTIRCAHKAILPITELRAKFHPKNRNKHPQDQIERLANILAYQGIRWPVKISNRSGLITAGHGRILAAIENGWDKFPVDYQDYDSEEQEYADVQADNAIASWAELDLSGINTDVPDLGPDFDIDMLGIKDFVIEPADKMPGCDEDEVPDKVEANAKTGDIYQLGRHRLMCGDSTDIGVVEKLMDGQKACATFTSPPYNLGDNAKLRGYNGDGNDSAYLEKSDHKSQDEYLSFLSAFTLIAMKFSTTVFVNIQLLAGNKLALPQYWMAFKDNLIDLMCWDKEHAPPQMAERVLNSVWEFIFIFTDEHQPKRSIKTGAKFRGNTDNIFRMNPIGKKDPLAKDHGAVFPVAFAEHFAEHFAEKSVLDLFGGSGSTLIACEKTNRKCFMMEIDPHYVDVIIARWEKYTGQKAELLNGQAKEANRPKPTRKAR